MTARDAKDAKGKPEQEGTGIWSQLGTFKESIFSYSISLCVLCGERYGVVSEASWALSFSSRFDDHLWCIYNV